MPDTSTATQLRMLPLEWVKPPHQARTHATLGKLLDAAEQLLAEKSWGDIAVAELAKAAGSSVGAFYRRFGDKDALLHAVHERYVQEAMATADATLDVERWHGATLFDVLEQTVGFVIQVWRERRGLDRAVFERALVDDVFKERNNRMTRYVVECMTKLVDARSEEVSHPRPDIAVQVALRQTFGFLTDSYTIGLNDYGAATLSDDELAHEIARSMTAYLGAQNRD